MVADGVEEDTEIDQVLEAAEADMEDQGQLKPRLLLQLEMNKPVRLRNFLHPCFHLFAISKLDFWGNLFRKWFFGFRRRNSFFNFFSVL